MVYHRLKQKLKEKLGDDLAPPFNGHLNPFTSGVYKLLSEGIQEPIWRELDVDLYKEEHE